MRERDLSARALAAKTLAMHHVNRNRIGALLSDDTSPTLADVLALAAALGVPPAELLPAELTPDPSWAEVALALDLDARGAIDLRDRTRAELGRHEVTSGELLRIWLRDHAKR